MLRVTDVFSLGGNWVVFFIQPHWENFVLKKWREALKSFVNKIIFFLFYLTNWFQESKRHQYKETKRSYKDK